MFLDNLSTALLRLCETHNLKYGKAADRCNISTRYFGKLVRMKAAPTILVIEKICDGFGVTPNELLLLSKGEKEVNICQPMEVKLINVVGSVGYAACPQCNAELEAHTNYCSNCGQPLAWEKYDKSEIAAAKK